MTRTRICGFSALALTVCLLLAPIASAVPAGAGGESSLWTAPIAEISALLQTIFGTAQGGGDGAAAAGGDLADPMAAAETGSDLGPDMDPNG